MAHQSLYRKYRPQTFSDVVGQDHITRTLRNAVEEGSVAHAYLFCGPRGTGKTTTARILAKALDCEKGPTPDPDITCQACVEIAEGRHPDVFELDAASRTGVDAIRDEIITKVNYASTRGGYKIYIIDEVHMLSTSAFNALLKTLEEPPSHVVFVLCTTHPHKVPETIHSRCQRFDFRRIGMDDIVGRLAYIAGEERIKVADGALPLIARHAAGGMRDAIGTLDQLASFTGSNIALADVEGLLGEVDAARLFELADLVTARDAAGCFAFVAKLAESGTDLPEFVRAFTGHIRDLYVTAASGDPSGLVLSTAESLPRLEDQASALGADRLMRLLDLLGQLTGEMRWASDQRLALEVALVRMSRPEADLTLESLAERLSSLEAGMVAAPEARAPKARAAEPVAPGAREVAQAAPSAVSAERSEAAGGPKPARAEHAQQAPRTEAAVEPRATTESAPVTEVTAAERVHFGTVDRAALKRSWPDVLRDLKASAPAKSKLFLNTDVEPDGDTVVVAFNPGFEMNMKIANSADTVAMLRDSLETVLGVKMAVRYQLGRGGVRPEETDDFEPGPASLAAAPGSAAPDSAPRDRVESPGRAEPATPAAHGGDVGRALMDVFGTDVVQHTIVPGDGSADPDPAAEEGAPFVPEQTGMLDDDLD
jgi:DNA polymerase-3 subunit gamma/tau